MIVSEVVKRPSDAAPDGGDDHPSSAATSKGVVEPSAARHAIEPVQRQFGQVLDMQVNEGQHLRREVDQLRDELHAARVDLRARVEQCANADAVENRDRQLVQYFNAEALRSRAAMSELQDQVSSRTASLDLLRERDDSQVPECVDGIDEGEPEKSQEDLTRRLIEKFVNYERWIHQQD